MTMIEGEREDPLVYSPEKKRKLKKKKEMEGAKLLTINVFSLWCDKWKSAEVLQNKLCHPCEMDPAS